MDFTALIAAFQGHQYLVAVGLALSAITYAVRNWIVPNWAWAKTDRGGVILAFVVSVLGTVGTALATGTATPGVILDTLAALFLSTGAYSVVHKLTAPAAPPAPPKVG